MSPSAPPLRADLTGLVYWESNSGKTAIGGEVGSEWHLRVENTSPNARHLVGHTLDIHPSPNLQTFDRRRVTIQADVVTVGVERHRPEVRIRNIAAI